MGVCKKLLSSVPDLYGGNMQPFQEEAQESAATQYLVETGAAKAGEDPSGCGDPFVSKIWKCQCIPLGQYPVPNETSLVRLTAMLAFSYDLDLSFLGFSKGLCTC
jgi:hypothetical protein